jgi:hypothetical protein
MAEKNDVNSDLHYLNLLSIFHYVLGGMRFLFGFFPIIYVVMGIVMLLVPGKHGGNDGFPNVLFGGLMVVFGLGFAVAMWVMAVMMIIAGHKLSRHKSYMFCIVIACIECLSMPFGTILGVFTIILLSRPSVKELFNPTQTAEQISVSQRS